MMADQLQYDKNKYIKNQSFYQAAVRMDFLSLQASPRECKVAALMYCRIFLFLRQSAKVCITSRRLGTRKMLAFFYCICQ